MEAGRALRGVQVAAFALLLGLIAVIAFTSVSVVSAEAEDEAEDETQEPILVPSDWPLRPTGVAEGSEFRLLVLTRTKKDALSTNIADYDEHVRADLAKADAHSSITPYADQFQVVGSTATVAARDHINANSADGSGVPIYWLNGARVARTYQEFFSGTWEDYAARRRDGRQFSTSVRVNLEVHTGTNNDGTIASMRYLGTTEAPDSYPWVATGKLRDGGALRFSGEDPGDRLRYYAISPVFRVADADAEEELAESPALVDQGRGICDRTPQVKDAILDLISEVSDCADVTDVHLSAVSGSLRLPHTGITAVQDGDFDGLSGIMTLELYSDPISSLPDGIFSDLTSLTRLKLKNNNIPSISEATFSGLTNLTYLDLSINRIATIPDFVFSGLPNLTTLKLNGNGISSISATSFSGLSHLAYLDLRNNALTDLPDNGFSDLSSLEELVLLHNDIRSLGPQAFAGLTSLEELFLESNELNEDRLSRPFAGLSTLTTLSISFNLIQHNFPSSLFEGLTALESLRAFINHHIGNVLPLRVHLRMDDEGRLKVEAPTGAPYDIVMPIVVTNGTLEGDVASLTVPTGRVESTAISVTRAVGTTGPVVARFGNAPPIPSGVTEHGVALHSGYEVVRGNSTLELLPALEPPNADDPESISSLTAAFIGMPETHDGETRFTFELQFSEEPAPDFGYTTLRDHAFTVTGGAVTKARRLAPPGNVRWEITVLPNSDAEITVVLPVTADCEDEGAICTGDGRMLSAEVMLSVAGPEEEEETPAENNPATGVPTISGIAQVGETLTADTSGISDADGMSGATFSYQWVRNDGSGDADIAGATGATYTLVDAAEGKTIRVRVSFTDDAENGETLTSAATATVQARPNTAATGAPTISGTAQVGETLTADRSGISDADGLSNTTFSYQWIRNDGSGDADIAGATGATYTLVDADEGKTIKVRVAFVDNRGHQETSISAATAAIVPAPDSESETEEDGSIWSATMTAGLRYDGYGYSSYAGGAGELSDTAFDLDGVTYTITTVVAWGWMYITVDKALPTDLAFQVDGTRFDLSDASLTTYSYASKYRWSGAETNWSNGDNVQLTLDRVD